MIHEYIEVARTCLILAHVEAKKMSGRLPDVTDEELLTIRANVKRLSEEIEKARGSQAELQERFFELVHLLGRDVAFTYSPFPQDEVEAGIAEASLALRRVKKALGNNAEGPWRPEGSP